MQLRRLQWLLLGLLGSIAAIVLGGIIWSERTQTDRVARVLTGGDPSRAPSLLRRYGCAGCHTIPGLSGADGQVGGVLSDMRRRVYIGGAALNSSENLARWIVSPQTYSPGTAMPETGISETEARDVAAFLYAQ
jgi:cytochrome c1